MAVEGKARDRGQDSLLSFSGDRGLKRSKIMGKVESGFSGMIKYINETESVARLQKNLLFEKTVDRTVGFRILYRRLAFFNKRRHIT
jgi:hypothetical protein